MSRRAVAVLWLPVLALFVPAVVGASKIPFPPPGGPNLPGLFRTQAHEGPSAQASGNAARQNRAAAVDETVWIYRDSLNTRSSPSNEGGWTHRDDSAKPIEWHRDTFLACQGTSWWCGHIDPSWTFDSNNAGYDNSWTQVLLNSADLNDPPPGTPVTISFRHYFNAEPAYDFGFVEVLDLEEDWFALQIFDGVVPNGGGCDSFTVAVPESIWTRSKPLHFRFRFTSDIGFSSADGLYDGDGWVVDNVTVKAGATIAFFDDMESGPGTWEVTTLPGVGDYYFLRQNLSLEDLCTTNTTKVWTMWDPITESFVPRLDNQVVAPPVATNQASEVFVAFDVYRNLPLLAYYYYWVHFRTKDIGGEWSQWTNPTGFVYYGADKDWLRRPISLGGAGGHDSVQVELGVRDFSDTFGDGVPGGGGVYTLFDNIAIGVVATAPPSFITRDIDFFNDTFQTTPFYVDDNWNTPIGDSGVVQVNASFGYKEGFMYYRINGGSFTSIPLARSAPALPNHFYADLPAGASPANSTLEYYFSATDSIDQTSYFPSDAITNQRYLKASILPLKTAINPPLGCTDSLASILFVNHYVGFETTPQIANALTGLGFKYDTWDVNGPSTGAGNCLGGAIPGDQQFHWPATDVNSLLQYSTIIWHSGDLTAFNITEEDQALLQSWIQQPGKSRNLWISGDDFARELATTGVDFNSFLAFTCGMRYIRDNWENSPKDSLHPTVTGFAGSPSAGRSFNVNLGCPILNDADVIALSTFASSGKSGNFLKYPNGLAAATRYATKYSPFPQDSARSLFMGFSFNNIEQGGERLQVLNGIVKTYFKESNCYVATAVESDPVAEAPGFANALAQNAPNPFNPETTIRYSVARAGEVTIRVYDVGGSRVRTLLERPHAPGNYTVRWNGVDDVGRRVGSGVYFYSIETADGFRDAKRLILLK